ncbi:MAG: bifunctional metallophosphatase/5'-nucleotidase [Clostridia bacterium]|nr:bifunctional metallophosphatase/5'-nucleotidase [Clostridia bacterium]
MLSKRMIALILCAVITLFSLSSCNSFDALVGESDTPSVNTDSTGGETNGTDEGVGNATGGATDGGSTDGGETPTEKPTDAPIDRDAHTDEDNDGSCDDCGISVIITFDFYALNDLHGKFDDTDSQGGVDELSTYLANAYNTDDNVILLSSGDMWQGSFESNSTKGLIITDWMNELDFVSMTLGNHEYDWGEESIKANVALAEFPFLAINIYERDTNERVDYVQSSVLVERGGMKIGIIGAIGDCYSSISGDKVEDVYFKTGAALTELVKAESEKLRAEGADYIVYSIHGGFGSNSSASMVQTSSLRGYYDASLSKDGYVDLVFEGHTHKSYAFEDEYGVPHLQNGGDNSGISHVEVRLNFANGYDRVSVSEIIKPSRYANLEDHPIVDELLQKYADQVDAGKLVLGQNSRLRNSTEIKNLVADLYYEAGIERWGDKYDIALGGGFISVRSPYDLAAGEVKYSDLNSLLPFDNQLVLCSIKGRDLKNKFFETNNSNYYIAYGDYGASIRNNIDYNATYYIITDTYCSSYAYNNLTVVDYYDAGVYARDLIADYIRAGGLQ